MSRRGNVGRRRGGGRKAGSTYRGSDGSDEDYTVDVDEDDEFDESDGYSSFVGDDSEESLGEYEEEEKKKTRRVKRVVRSRVPRRKRSTTVKPRKRKRVSYREDDDDEDEDGVDEDDVEFTPDCLDEEEKFSVMKGMNKTRKSRSRKSTVKADDEEEDEDEEEFNPDGMDEEEEFAVVKGMRTSRKPRLRKGTIKDYDEEDDEDEFSPDGLDKEVEFPCVKGKRNSRKPRLTVKDDTEEEEDDEEEEFNPDGLDKEDEFPGGKVKRNSRKPRLTVKDDTEEEEEEDDDEEEDVEFNPDGLDKEDEFPCGKGKRSSSKHNSAVKNDEGEDEDDGEEFNPDFLDKEEEFPSEKGMRNSSKPPLRKGAIKNDDEGEDEDDEEFNPDGLDEDEEFPEVAGTRNSSKPSLSKGSVKDDEDDDEEDEDDAEFVPDDLDEEEESLVMNSLKNSSKQQLQMVALKDDIEDDVEENVDDGEEHVDDGEENEDDVEFTPDGLDEEDDSPVTKRKNNSRKPWLRTETARYDDEEDEDDEEFTPDDLDEEEESTVMKEMKNSRKPRLRNGTAKEQKRNRTHQEWRKISRKKPQKRRQMKRKARPENDDDFIDVDPIVEGKNKNIAGQRKKRKSLRGHSDSDFVVSSGPSDHEFTISEEEREQVREASKFCRGLVTASRGSSSFRNSSKEEMPRPQRKVPGRKDKEKVGDLNIEAGKQTCGICLSEEGKRTIRGTLNCCSHYFCFACIMEWSKVESRCPLCKQRFVTISKPARSNTGFDLRTVVIQVPERDQVYQPSEEELRGYLDPYENVLCTECHQGGDDALMLLCDLCDSPAHTYCVGLGREVPEGNWYCESCRPTALAASNPQNIDPTPDNRTSSSNYSVASPPVANVRETFDLNEMYVPDTPLAEESGDFQSPRDGQAASFFSGVGAFTVSDRRRIQRQIHQLLNNRRRQYDNITGTLGAVSGNGIFGSQIARNRELATQPALVQRAVPQYSLFQGRHVESNAHLSHNRMIVPERSSNFSRQLNLNAASSSSQSFFGDFLENELQGTDASMSLGLIHPQLHPCSNRSYIGPETSPSPYPFRESTVPSRTLSSTLRRPF